MTSGFISISNRDAIRIMINLGRGKDDQILDSLKPYDFAVAGPNLYFMIGTIPALWLLVLCFENKVFDRFKRKGKQD